ncbi:MAG: MATE family efflux transporter [Treponema sp.]|nr:MATE family efflux transporter [Treponema sp.]
MTAAYVLNLLYNIVDRIYIGRIPDSGALALTGVGLCFPIITFISAFPQLFGSGGAPLFGIQMGEKNNDEAERIMGTSFTMLIISGIAITILGIIFHEPILYLFGASESTFSFAKDYILIYISGTLFSMISLGMNPFINGQGFGRTGMLTVLIGAVINIILDPIFIFVFSMGIRGAALATIISQAISAIWVILFLTGPQAALKLQLKKLTVAWKRLKKILALGLSTFVMSITTSIVQVVCNVSLSNHGGDKYVGVMTIINSVREIFSLPLTGLTNGSIPVMSFNYGSKTFTRIKQAIRFTTITGIAYAVIAWLVIFLFPELFIRIFTDDQNLITAGIPALHIYFFGFFMMVLQVCGQCTFLALGKAKQAIFFSIFRKVIIVVPWTLILPSIGGLGVNGVFWAEPISNVLGGLACFTTMLLTVLPELKETKTLH